MDISRRMLGDLRRLANEHRRGCVDLWLRLHLRVLPRNDVVVLTRHPSHNELDLRSVSPGGMPPGIEYPRSEIDTDWFG